MATVAELKVKADSLGIKYTSKIRKADLELMVSEALAGRERVAASRIAPMSMKARIVAYREQTGSTQPTPRQARRMRHKDNRAKGRA